MTIHQSTKTTLVTAVAGAMLLLGVPARSDSPAERASERVRLQVRLAADELRAAITSFRLDQGRLPGFPDGPYLEPRASAARFVDDLTGPGGTLAAIPTNPFNGRDDVRLVEPAGPRPPEITGGHGWIFDPRSGEVWLDLPPAPGALLTRGGRQ